MGKPMVYRSRIAQQTDAISRYPPRRVFDKPLKSRMNSPHFLPYLFGTI